MDHPIERDYPDVENQIAAVREACVDADVPVGRVTHDPDAARDAIDNGYQILRVGGEL